MTLSVHLLQPFDSDWTSRLQKSLAGDIELSTGDQPPQPARYHVLIAGRPEKHHLTASPCLHSLVIPWSGLPEATRKILVTDDNRLVFPDLAVYNIHHNAAPAAETALTLMMAAAKRLIPVDRALRLNDWTPRYIDDTAPPDNSKPADLHSDKDQSPLPKLGPPLLLDGKTAMVLGYGAIGRKIAAACRSLGMKIIAVKSNLPAFAEEDAALYTLTALPRLLPQADVLFVCLPLTPQTENLIGQTELSLLHDHAIVVNIARGPIIDEKALYDALKTGRLRAGLDVWYTYPKKQSEWASTSPSRYPFGELPNVVMTPHLGGHSDMTETLRLRELTELINTINAGRIPPGIIDPVRGY